MLFGLGADGPTDGDTGDPPSRYEGGCDDQWCCGGAGGGGAEYDDERILLTGAPFGSELGAHCPYWPCESVGSI